MRGVLVFIGCVIAAGACSTWVYDSTSGGKQRREQQEHIEREQIKQERIEREKKSEKEWQARKKRMEALPGYDGSYEKVSINVKLRVTRTIRKLTGQQFYTEDTERLYYTNRDAFWRANEVGFQSGVSDGLLW